MTTTNTPDMPITTKKILASHVIKLKLSPLVSPLFLGDVTITEVATMTGVTGVIHPGTAASAGNASLQVSSQVYGNLAAFISNNSSLVLEIWYDDASLVPSDIGVGSTQPFARVA